MKFFVFSDLHGSKTGVQKTMKAIERERPDVLVFLGDTLHGAYDADASFCMDFFRKYRERVLAVCGNCDDPCDLGPIEIELPPRRGLDFSGRRIHLTHRPDVFAFPPGDVVFNGHTHCKCLYSDAGTIRCNPGSVSVPRDDGPGYAIMDEAGVYLKNLNTLETLEFIGF